MEHFSLICGHKHRHTQQYTVISTNGINWLLCMLLLKVNFKESLHLSERFWWIWFEACPEHPDVCELPSLCEDLCSLC